LRIIGGSATAISIDETIFQLTQIFRYCHRTLFLSTFHFLLFIYLLYIMALFSYSTSTIAICVFAVFKVKFYSYVKISEFCFSFSDSPTCHPNQTRVHGVAKQEKADISCRVDANPPDVHFKWSFNNTAESMDVSSNHISRSGTRSTVTYTPITEMDYGTLLCWASNSIGEQRLPCVFHIIAAGSNTLFSTSMYSYD